MGISYSLIKLKRFIKQSQHEKAITKIKYILDKHTSKDINSIFGEITLLGYVCDSLYHNDILPDDAKPIIEYLLENDANMRHNMTSYKYSYDSPYFETKYIHLDKSFIIFMSHEPEYANMLLDIADNNSAIILNFIALFHLWNNQPDHDKITNYIKKVWAEYFNDTVAGKKMRDEYHITHHDITLMIEAGFIDYMVEILKLNESHMPVINTIPCYELKTELTDIIVGVPMIDVSYMDCVDEENTKFAIPRKIYTASKCIVCDEAKDLLMMKCGHAVLCQECHGLCPDKNKCQYCNTIVDQNQIVLITSVST